MMETGSVQTDDNLREKMSSPRIVSGSRVVVGLFMFGILTTAGLWIYWKLHLAPFFPLQQSLAEAFENSSPRVEGGRTKNSPFILRIVLQVPFRPVRGQPDTESTLDRTVDLALRYPEIGKYEVLEIYLVHPVPEKMADRLKVEFKIAELQKREAQAGTRGANLLTRGLR